MVKCYDLIMHFIFFKTIMTPMVKSIWRKLHFNQNDVIMLDTIFSQWHIAVIELSKCRWGSWFSVGGGVERRGGWSTFFQWGVGVEKEARGRILSSTIEETGKWHNKLSSCCKSFIWNLFKIRSHCLPQQCLIIKNSQHTHTNIQEG